MNKAEEYFYSKENWEECLDYATRKGISKEIITMLTMPEGRCILFDAIDEGRYVVEPPRVQLIPKDNGEFRKVYINTPLDRIVLHAINNALCHEYPNFVHPNCVSYQKGLGVDKVIKRVLKSLEEMKGLVLGYKVDLSKYFDSVNKKTLYDFLDNKMPLDGRLKEIVNRYYHDDRIIDENGQLVEHYKSLSQGCSISAFLANAVLYPIDEELSEMNILYYRYSDDILLIGKDADKALSRLQEMLEERGLSLNPKKIERIEKGKPFSFLGFSILDGVVTLTKKKENAFKKQIKDFTKLKKGMKRYSRTEQKKAIKKILKMMSFTRPNEKNNYGWSQFYFKTINSEEYIKYLDEYVKDHIKMLYTGKGNHTTNRNKTPNELLMDMGYISMVRLWKDYNKSVDLFNAELLSLAQ